VSAQWLNDPPGGLLGPSWRPWSTEPSQALALTAREALEEVAESDVRTVALFARTALGAEPCRAAEQVRRELEERVRRLAEERARRQK
jgi:hypothetical protein